MQAHGNLKTPKERKPIKWRPLSAKTNTIQQQRYLESSVPEKKTPLRNPTILFIKKHSKKKEQFRKRARLILFRAKNYVKKSMGSKVPTKKCMSSKKKVPPKKEFILFGAKQSANKSMGSKKSMSSKKKELILFSGQTLCQKKEGSKNKSSKKKRNSYLVCSSHTLCRKKYKCQKKYEFRKKKGTHTFTGLTLHQKIMGSEKRTHSFSGQQLCQKKVWVPKQ